MRLRWSKRSRCWEASVFKEKPGGGAVVRLAWSEDGSFLPQALAGLPSDLYKDMGKREISEHRFEHKAVCIGHNRGRQRVRIYSYVLRHYWNDSVLFLVSATHGNMVVGESGLNTAV